MSILVCMMPHGGGRGPGHSVRQRAPPSWNPDNAHNYSFRHYCQDLLAWSILARELDETEQAAAIILELQGPARELFREFSHHDYTNGGIIGGVQVGPVTFIMATLAYVPILYC